jgi:hypothetical protein
MVFGVTLRGAAALALGTLLTIIDDEIMGYVIDAMNHPDHWLVGTFESIVIWDTTILLIGVIVMVLANALVRSDATI